ncbi:MAG: hypothetical protein Aurels2KO_15620 [Aureliella sp.]
MNGIGRLTVVLLAIFILGCADRTNESEPERLSDSHSVAPANKETHPVVSVDQLQGVHPNRPLILKTNAFDFRSSDSGATIVCADRQGVGVWDMATGKRNRLIEHSEVVLGVEFSPTDNALLTVATGKSTPARLWDLQTGTMLKEFSSPFASDNETSQIRDEDYGWNLWRHPDIWRFARTGIVPQAGFGFTCCAFGPAAKNIAAGCEDGRIIIWDAATAAPTKTLDTGIPRILALAFSVDGSRMLAAARDDIIQLWDLDKNEMLRQFDETRRVDWAAGYRPAIAFSADGSKFALYSPRTLEILICDSTAGEILHRIQEPSRLPSGKLHFSLQRGLAFTDETTLFSNTGGWIKIWNFTTGELIQHQECQSGVNAGYAYPSIQYVQFLPRLDAFVAVEVENDENTNHDDWTTISLRPRKLFERTP